MNLEIKGNVIRKLDQITGEGKNGAWIKQDFVIETTGEYPKKVCFTTWGDKAKVVNKLKKDELVTVSFNPESREYEGKWFTDLRAWKISKGDTQPAAAPQKEQPAQQENNEDLPF